MGSKNERIMGTDMSTPRSSFGLAALDGYLYAAGGLDEHGKASMKMEYYDPKILGWSDCKNLLSQRANFGLVAFGGMLYAVGGTDLDGDLVLNMELYDPRTQAWTRSCHDGLRTNLGVTAVVDSERN